MDNSWLQSVSVAQGAVPALAITSAVMLLLPVVFVIVWKSRCKKAVSFAPLFIGAVGFLVSARVLELGVHMVCIVMDNPISRFINGSTLAYVLYGIFMAGIFEECGRYVIIRFIMKKNKTRENMIMYGIGHGGIEVWFILMTVVSLLAIDIIIKSQGIESALQLLGASGELSPSSEAALKAQIKTAADFNLATGALYVIERLGAMVVHIALTVVVSYGIVTKQKKYLFAAILSHAAIDISAALYQCGAAELWLVEVWLWICVVLLVIWSRGLYRKMKENN